MLTLLIPGRYPITNFCDDGTGVNRYIFDVPNVNEISDVILTLNQPLPSDDCGVGIYFTVPGICDWEFLGVLTNSRPSHIFNTGWSLREDFKSAPGVRFGVMLESSKDLIEKIDAKPQVFSNKEIARKAALNLYRFIESFATIGADRTLKCPQDVLDRWLTRFDEKSKRDPYFFMRTE